MVPKAVFTLEINRSEKFIFKVVFFRTIHNIALTIQKGFFQRKDNFQGPIDSCPRFLEL